MDLISFEDLVVQPYNSYFNLEKELHDEIVIVEENVQKDIRSIKDRLDLLEYESDEETSLPSIYIDLYGNLLSNEKYYGSMKENKVDITLKYKNIDNMELVLFNEIDLDKLLRIFKNTKIRSLFIYSYPKIQSVINLIMLHSIKVSYLQIENNLSKNEVGKLQWYCNENKIKLKRKEEWDKWDKWDKERDDEYAKEVDELIKKNKQHQRMVRKKQAERMKGNV